MLRKLFGPAQSLILLYDHVSHEASLELREALEEIGRYYRFQKISDIVGKKGRANLTGAAVLAFRNPRKSVWLHVLPHLVAEEIPFTVFLHPDCIGLNRLPLEEELSIYRAHYPEGFPDERYRELVDKAWTEPQVVEAFLGECRRTLGPMPLDKLDPTSYFVTWGKVREVPPRLLELGLHLTTSPTMETELAEASEFIRKLAGRSPAVAFSSKNVPEGALPTLERQGIEALVTPREGAVEKDTGRYQLPIWRLERS